MHGGVEHENRHNHSTNKVKGWCKIHGKMELDNCETNQIIELDPRDYKMYVLISNIYRRKDE